MFESTNAIGEGKNVSTILDVRLRLKLKLSNLPPMHFLRFELKDIFFSSSHTTRSRTLCQILIHPNQCLRT